MLFTSTMKGTGILLIFNSKVKKYIKEVQKTGDKTYAEQVYKETREWLKSRGCEKNVNPQLVENYAQMIGRYIQCEQFLNQTGLLSKNPKTGEVIESPFVKMSLDYLNAASRLWEQIYKAVEEYAI